MNQNSSMKEKALDPESMGKSPVAQGVARAEDARRSPSPEPDDRIRIALSAASDKKALDPVVLDLREIASFTDYFVITSGANTRQVQAIADGIAEQLKKRGAGAARVEGYATAEWILLDYGDFVIHVFEEKARRFYDLERLWRDAIRVELPLDPDTASESSLRRES